MTPEAALDRLCTAAVLTTDTTGNEIRITPQFSKALARERDRIEQLDNVHEEIITELRDGPAAGYLSSDLESSPEILSTLRTIRDYTNTDDPEELWNLTVAFLHYRCGDSSPSSVPDSFFPVKGDRLPVVLSLSPRAIVYFWKDDCEPCSLVHNDLNETFPEPRDNISLFAVQGSRWPRFLQETYDVVGAPTLLFVENGKVATRLVGAHSPDAIRAETHILESSSAFCP